MYMCMLAYISSIHLVHVHVQVVVACVYHMFDIQYACHLIMETMNMNMIWRHRWAGLDTICL